MFADFGNFCLFCIKVKQPEKWFLPFLSMAFWTTEWKNFIVVTQIHLSKIFTVYNIIVLLLNIITTGRNRKNSADPTWSGFGRSDLIRIRQIRPDPDSQQGSSITWAHSQKWHWPRWYSPRHHHPLHQLCPPHWCLCQADIHHPGSW